MRDCRTFPCDLFVNGLYPYSQGFLNMQKRRRKESPPLKTPSGYEVDVPATHWEDLQAGDMERICENALAKQDSTHNIFLPFILEYIKMDPKERSLYRQIHGDWERVQNPLLELVCLIYLLHAGPQGLTQKMVSPEELKTGHFFRGPHVLKTRPLVERYGFDIPGFKNAADRIGGQTLDFADAASADAAYVFQAFPKVPLYYLLWEGDEEFQPRLSVLFDRSIEHHLTADAIWGLVTLVSDALIVGKPI
jgi:hypothetical protein